MATSGPNFPTAATNLVDGGATTWSATSSAFADDGVFALWTKAGGVAAGTLSQALELSGYGTFTGVSSGDTINSVTVAVNAFANQTARIDQVRYQLYNGTTAIGTEQTAASTNVGTTVLSFAFTGVTFAQLSTLRVRVRFRGGATTTTAVGSLDYASLTVDYTALAPIGRTVDDGAGLADSPIRDDTSVVGTELVTLTDDVSTQLVTSIAYTRSATDVAGASDVASAVSVFARSATDATGLSDSGQQIARSATGTDSVGLSDVASTQLTAAGASLVRTITDVAGATDAAAAVNVFARLITDSSGNTDTAAAVNVFARLVTDSAGNTDAAATSNVLTRLVADSAGNTDAAAAANVFARLVADSAGNIDVAATANVVARLVADSAGNTDTTTAQLGSAAQNYTRIVNDDAGLIDFGQQVARSATGVDSAGLSDAATTQLTSSALTRVVTDLSGLTDSASPSVSGGTNATVSPATVATVSEIAAPTIQTSVSLFRSTVEAVASIPAPTVVTTDSGILRVINDSLSLSDTIGQVSSPGTRQHNDFIGLTDSVVTASTAARTVNDFLTLTDSVDVTVAGPGVLIFRNTSNLVGLTDDIVVQLAPTLSGVDLMTIAFATVTGAGEYIRNELVDTEGGVPQRFALIVPGAIAWDGCDCGQFAQSITNVVASRVFPTPATDVPAQTCGHPQAVISVTVSLLRCIPGMDDSGRPPNVDSLFAAARILEDDRLALRRGLNCYLREQYDQYKILNYTIGAAQSVGPEGQCGGIEMNYSFGITNDAACCG